jgi:thiol-disulfide isomerase/thioredoxin
MVAPLAQSPAQSPAQSQAVSQLQAQLKSQEVPADAVLRDFELTGDYLLEVDGAAQSKAKIYQSRLAGGFLVRSAALAQPVLLLPREGSVQGVSVLSLSMQPDGNVDILADAELIPEGKFSLEGGDVLFEVDGRKAKLKPNPPLTGLHGAKELFEHSAAYGQKAAKYLPDEASLELLRQQDKAVRVKTFFGSWCPFCKDYVPHLLKVDQLLEGSKIEFQYYGLPEPPFNEETAAKAEKVTGVPTAIIYVDGKEVGRLKQSQWVSPEKALVKALKGS